MKLEDYKKKVHEFLRSVGTDDSVVIVFHNDGDGICSAALLAETLDKMVGVKPLLISQPMPTDKNLGYKVGTTVPTKIIFLDLAVDQHPDVVKKVSRGYPTLIIDHHQVHKDMNNDKVVHYNPRFDDAEIYQSASYITYKLCSGLVDLTDKLWVAGIGIVSDYDVTSSEDIIEEIRSKYGFDGDLYETDIGKVVNMISAARATKGLSSEQIADILIASNELNDVLSNDKLRESFMKIENEMVAVNTDFESSSEKYKNLIMYELKSDYNLRSSLSTSVSEKFHDKLVVIYQKMGANFKASGRNQSDKFNVAKVFQRAVKNLEGWAGGHDNAAGATVREKDWEDFKKKLIKIAGE